MLIVEGRYSLGPAVTGRKLLDWKTRRAGAGATRKSYEQVLPTARIKNSGLVDERNRERIKQRQLTSDLNQANFSLVFDFFYLSRLAALIAV
jgi:hypothetical protein